MSRTRVFTPEPTDRYDLTEAQVFGEVVPLLKSAAPFSPEGIMLDFNAAFEDQQFNPAVDFICLTGKSLAVALLLSAALLRYDKIKVLMFDAPTSKYIQRNIDKEFLSLEKEVRDE